MRPAALTVLLGLGVFAMAGSVRARPAGGDTSVNDPFEKSNRTFYEGQDALDRHIFLPLSKFYHSLTPGPIGKAIHNVLSNLTEPVVIANDLLQGRFKRAGHETLRMTANTTAGWLGLMDVATPAGLPKRDNDFGITLGRWGVKPGPYLYLPLLGPSTVRDAIGMGADAGMDPLNFVSYPDRIAVAVTKAVVSTLDTRVEVQGQLDALLGDATDPYATLRSVYLQNREAMIRGDDEAPVLAPLDDIPPDTTPGTAAPTATDPAAATPPPAATPPGATPAPDAAPAPAATPAPAPAAATPPPQPAAVSSIDNPDRDAPVTTARDWRPMTASNGAPAPSA